MNRITLSDIWEKVETRLPYLFLLVLLGGEILASAFPKLSAFSTERSRVILLAAALVLMFRSIERGVASSRGQVEEVTFADGLREALEHSRAPRDVMIMANDGVKYYTLLSEFDVGLDSVKLLLHDAGSASRWFRLLDRGLIRSLEVRLAGGAPAMHCFVASEQAAIFGGFVKRGSGFSPRRNTLMIGGNRGTREAILALEVVFEQMWIQAEVIPRTDAFSSENST